MNERTRREKCKTCGEWSKVFEHTGSCVDVATCDMHAAGYTQADLDDDMPAPAFPRHLGLTPSYAQVNAELGRDRVDRFDEALDFAGVTSEDINREGR